MTLAPRDSRAGSRRLSGAAWRRWSPVALAVSIAVVGGAELRDGTFALPGLVGIACLVFALVWWRGGRGRVLALNAIIIGGIFVAAEGYLLWAGRPSSPELTPPLSQWKRMRESAISDVYFYPSPPWGSDPQLGSIHAPHTRTRERRYLRGRLVAYAQYTTESHGFRSAKRADRDADSVLLFGCSMTFGFNLQDSESYPWQLGERLGSRFQVRNFGVAGSGPNTMLRVIEAGYEAEGLPSGQVRGAYYVAWLQRGIGHLARILGRVPWGASAPRFRLSSAPEPPYVLPAGSMPLVFDQWLTHHSLVTAQLGRALGTRRIDPRYTPDDVALLVGIVRESDRLLRARHRVPLTVIILADRSSGDLELELARQLSFVGVRSLPVRLPPDAWIPHDIHPNARGAALLAATVESDLRGAAAPAEGPPQVTENVAPHL